jgi:hypothetical protein
MNSRTKSSRSSQMRNLTSCGRSLSISSRESISSSSCWFSYSVLEKSTFTILVFYTSSLSTHQVLIATERAELSSSFSQVSLSGFSISGVTLRNNITLKIPYRKIISALNISNISNICLICWLYRTKSKMD